jgi:ubiquinol-cytochrome c reductase cytochrome c1 subunit
MRLNKLALAGLAALAGALVATPVLAQEHAAGQAAGAEEHAAGGHHLLEPAGGWQHDGYFGTFDQNALQRGFKVYREVCSSCHAMELLSFRHLGEKGGPFYMEEFPNPNDNPKVKAIAAEYQIATIDPETGDADTRPGIPADPLPKPYANEAAGRGANGGAFPPDFSVLAKARHGGAGYIYSLMLGYVEPPGGLTVAPGQHYNSYFAGDTAAQWSGDPRLKPPGGFLAMTPPLPQDGLVTFDDDTPSTRAQMAKDVATFIAWSSDPKMQTRKQMGVAVLAYLVIMALLAYVSYRRIWRNVEH